MTASGSDATAGETGVFDLSHMSAALPDAVISNEDGSYQAFLSGVFDGAVSEGEELTITAASSDEDAATVPVAADQSSLTVTAKSRDTATITVADDGKVGAASDTFTVTVKAAPVVATALTDVSGLVAGATQTAVLFWVFSDAYGDRVVTTAASSDEAIATVKVASDGSILTVAGVAEGTAAITVTVENPDGNRGSDTFDVSVVNEPVPAGDATPGVTITAANPLEVAEGGAASYTMVLDTKPLLDVTITAASSDTAKAVIFPISYTFTPDGWNAPQSFYVRGPTDDDSNDETVLSATA